MDAASCFGSVPLVVVADGGVRGGAALFGGGVAALVSAAAVAATAVPVIPAAGPGTIRTVSVRVRHIINL